MATGVTVKIKKIVLLQSVKSFIIPVLLLIFGSTTWYRICIEYINKIAHVSTVLINRVYFCIVAIALIIAFIKLFSFLYTVSKSFFSVDDQSVKVSIVSFFRQYTSEMPLKSIENIHMYQNTWERFFNYGTIMIEGKGGGKIVFPMVSDPEKVYKIISDNIKEVNADAESFNKESKVLV